MAPHSSTPAWKIPWMEEPGRLQSMGSLRVRHDWAISLSLFTFMHWRRKWQPTPVFLPGESQGRGSLVGCRLWSHRVGHDWSDLAAVAAADNRLADGLPGKLARGTLLTAPLKGYQRERLWSKAKNNYQLSSGKYIGRSAMWVDRSEAGAGWAVDIQKAR